MLDKKLLLPIVLVATIAYSAVSAGLVFKSGERSEKDLARDAKSKGPEIVEMVGLKEGMIVADLLGGGGYYSEIISEKVGKSGRVMLHNNKAYMPYVEKELEARLENNRLSNVVRHDRETHALQFGESTLDAMFFVLGYHDIYHQAQGWKIDREGLLTQIRDAIKKDGKLVIVDHSAKEGTKTSHSQELHRIDEQYVVDELTSFGFKLVESSTILSNPNDDRTQTPFVPEMRRNTDRFVLIFKKL